MSRVPSRPLSVSGLACDHGSVKPAWLLLAFFFAVTAAARAEDLPPDTAAGDLVLRQIAALRVRDFTAAYACVSTDFRKHFTPGEFEWMVKRAHPEVASSAYAFVVRTHEAAGFLYVTVKVQGRNGQHVEALYEMVREKGQWRVNALSSRRDESVL